MVNIANYALPTWAGFLSADLTKQFNDVLKKCYNMGFGLQLDDVSELIEKTDSKLSQIS